VNSTPHPSLAAAGHFVEAERLVESLPLAGKRDERDHQARLATIHALLAIAASLLDRDPMPPTAITAQMMCGISSPPVVSD
jgi:hypothetical protein